MGCGCKKKKETTQTTPTPQTINVTVAEQESVKLSNSQEKLVNEIVDKLNKINESSQ